ncbi:hypothetical protein J6590_029251 [Homalodisca vitripennis]|nr:hypothetical protein J6590_029251 [Homalodisca vitripennis]
MICNKLRASNIEAVTVLGYSSASLSHLGGAFPLSVVPALGTLLSVVPHSLQSATSTAAPIVTICIMAIDHCRAPPQINQFGSTFYSILSTYDAMVIERDGSGLAVLGGIP